MPIRIHISQLSDETLRMLCGGGSVTPLTPNLLAKSFFEDASGCGLSLTSEE
jgi:hypothetical protein